ncbi:MAG TPA: lysophospholipid acyltransferase family protein [Acidimicrobiia bacterium]|nr:lysophospholipid acyltransferase family protein [Acidimicrobiia bacterium]
MTWKRKEYCWYRSGHALSTFFIYLLFRPKIVGRENVPKSGSLLIAPNHRSMLDIPILGFAVFRPMRFMAKKDLFANKFIKWYFETNGSFSVDKNDSDPAAVKKAVTILKSGDVLVVFPEGKRSKEPQVGEMIPGAGFIAIKAKAPILPIGISNLDNPFKLKFGFIPWFSRAKIVIGEPIISHLERSEKSSTVLNELLPLLQEQIQNLYDESLEI